MRTAFRVEADSAESVPAAGAVILAANHRSFMDSVFRQPRSLVRWPSWQRRSTSSVAA